MDETRFAELTRPGGGRATNEDAVAHWPHDDGIAFAVADGLGDDGGGQVASSLALEVLGRELAEAPAGLPMLRRLARAVQTANVELYQKRVVVPELREMGTTLTVTALVGPTVVAAHVGDCRLWLLRDGTLTQLTKDHTWAWEHADGRTLASEAVRARPRRYSLPRCLGHELIVSVDLLSMEVRTGDVLFQSSDGVHGTLREEELRELLEAHPPAAACQALLRRAHETDAEDDVSVQIAVVGPLPAARPWWRIRR